MSENRCPSCRRELPVADGIFCPYCGAALAKGDELPEPVRAALDAAGKENDPVKKYRLLCDAREAFPNCLPIEEELLFLGRLHERDGKNPTFDVIKCFLLHPYLTPKEFTPPKAGRHAAGAVPSRAAGTLQGAGPGRGRFRQPLSGTAQRGICAAVSGRQHLLYAQFFRLHLPQKRAPSAGGAGGADDGEHGCG